MHAIDLIGNYRLYTRHFNRTEYPAFFERYQNAARPFFNALDPSDAPAEAAALLDGLEAAWSAQRWKFRREAVMEDDKLLLVLYLAPAAVEHGSKAAAAFADELARQWNARWPDSPLRVGSFAEIQKGFARGIRLSWTARGDE